MGEREREGRGRMSWLIETATNSTSSEVDPRLVKAIKSVARSSDSEIHLAFDILMQKLEKHHSQVRYLALLIVDELFMRSKLFRSLLADKLDHFLSLSVGFRRSLPLPAPPDIATRLRSKAMEFLEKWNTSFGIHYRQLRLGFDYLKNTLHLQFPNLQQNAARREQERRERELRSKEILLIKFESLRENISSIKDEIRRTVDEIGECLDILRPKEDGSIILDPADSFEDFRCSALRQIRQEALEQGDKLQENSDNKVVFDALRELYKLLVTKHLASVQEWISLLIKVEPEDTRFRDSSLKEFIDLRNNLQSTKLKCEQSGCTLTDSEDKEDENIWEEVEIEPVSIDVSSAPSIASNNHAATAVATSPEKNHKSSDKARETSDKPTKSDASKKLGGKGEASDSTSLKSTLMAEAPVMTWGAFLDDWGIKRDFLANQRGLELEGHWGRVDYDAVIPAEKIAELNVQATLYKEEHSEIHPCLAPLKNGGLCQRRDIKVCPFHGPIIPRDPKGNPVVDQNLSTSTDDEAPESTTQVLEKLAKQAVKNVRGKDRDEATKRNDERQLKRAKVREHNETVLRQAAVASTSYSENTTGQTIQNGSSAKESKQALAAMLRKKIMPKDRIAKRLLNRRANDATNQLMAGEDAKYRDAYPNQW